MNKNTETINPTKLWSNACERLDFAKAYTFYHDDKKKYDPFKAAADSHDEGPCCGLSLGSIGTGSFGRDLNGHFKRWHFHCGRHYFQNIDPARLCLKWSQGSKAGFCQLGSKDWPNPAPESSRKVYSLFPITWEHYKSNQWPFEIILEMYSPLIPGNYDSSVLPVAHFDFYIINKSKEPVDIDIAFFWPNMLGWDPVMAHHKDVHKIWPDYSNAGNINLPYSEKSQTDRFQGVLFSRKLNEKIKKDMEGQFLLAVSDRDDLRISRQTSFYCGEDKNFNNRNKNHYNLEYVEDYFKLRGKLPDDDKSWSARWNEPIGGAVTAGKTFEELESDCLSFSLVWDMPLVRFASGRCWQKKYVSKFENPGRSSSDILKYAVTNKNHWRQDIDKWQKQTIERLTGANDWQLSPEVIRAYFNELYFIIDGGSVWVDKMAHPNGTVPTLGDREHFAILEGYDDGYWFYNTEDLWPYAMMAFSVNWPALADIVFDDLLESSKFFIDDKRMIYHINEMRKVHLLTKIPHDVGAPAEDPWHKINAYNIYLDSNSWKDHNTSFIISFYLHKHIYSENPITAEQYEHLKKVYEFVLSQDLDNDGLPEHNNYGDSTWDRLGIKGLGSYTGGLAMASLAALKKMAGQFNDAKGDNLYSELLSRAKTNYANQLWNGEYFKLDTQGKLGERIIVDALFGPYMASLAGLGELVDAEKVRSHLEKVYQYNYKSYSGGDFGPVLTYQKDGNNDSNAQSGEVLVGSAWIAVAMMYYYGLSKEANEIANTLSKVIYEDASLQFRTPAAWNNQRIYRAPLNMRPLAVSYIDPVLKEKSYEK